MQAIIEFIKRYPVQLMLALAVVAAIIFFITKPASTAVTNTETPRLIDSIIVEQGDNSPIIPVYAQVTTPELAKLRAAVTADVKALNQLPGDSVIASDDIVLLDDREPQLDVQQHEANVQEVRAQIADQNNKHENELFVLDSVNKRDANSKRNRENVIKDHNIQLQRLNAQLSRAQAALDLAKLNLSRTHIRAPFNGKVTALHVSAGDRVRPGDLIAEVYNQDAIELKGPVANRYRHTIQAALDKGNPLKVTFNLNGKPLTAHVSRVSGMVDKNNATTAIYFKPDAAADDLPLGKVIQLKLSLPVVNNSFALPLAALYGTDTVYRVVDSRLKRTTVHRHGDIYNDTGIKQVLVSSEEVSAGDVILATQLPNAVDNLLVSVKPDV